MLVLSRRQDQQIVFPNLHMKLQVLRIKGNAVSLGIQAPDDVKIIRGEIWDGSSAPENALAQAAGVDRHRWRNMLNTINLALRLFEKQTELGRVGDAQRTMRRLVEDLQRFDREVAEPTERVQEAVDARRVKVLVIEDDDNERELLAGLLRLHGLDVAVAPNGAEAFSYLQNADLPDYVLLDMKMAIGNGPSTLQGIRADDRLSKLKVIAVSGTSPDLMGVTQDAFDGWFVKPLDPEFLVKRIAGSTGEFLAI